MCGAKVRAQDAAAAGGGGWACLHAALGAAEDVPLKVVPGVGGKLQQAALGLGQQAGLLADAAPVVLLALEVPHRPHACTAAAAEARLLDAGSRHAQIATATSSHYLLTALAATLRALLLTSPQGNRQKVACRAQPVALPFPPHQVPV